MIAFNIPMGIDHNMLSIDPPSSVLPIRPRSRKNDMGKNISLSIKHPLSFFFAVWDIIEFDFTEFHFRFTSSLIGILIKTLIIGISL